MPYDAVRSRLRDHLAAVSADVCQRHPCDPVAHLPAALCGLMLAVEERADPEWPLVAWLVRPAGTTRSRFGWREARHAVTYARTLVGASRRYREATGCDAAGVAIPRERADWQIWSPGPVPMGQLVKLATGAVHRCATCGHRLKAGACMVASAVVGPSCKGGGYRCVTETHRAYCSDRCRIAWRREWQAWRGTFAPPDVPMWGARLVAV